MRLRPVLPASCSIASLPVAATGLAQVGGNLAAGPPLDIHLEITTSPDGPVLSTIE